MRYSNYAFNVPDEKRIRVIVDTDAANEGDDQFAVVHAMLSPRFDNVGFIAAHYGAEHPDGAERSREELLRIFSVMECPYDNIIYRGAPHAMRSASVPVPSEGSDLIVREAMKDDARPLFVLFLGPLTDLASAYLSEPRIAGRLTAVWIGGGAYPHGGPEFNLGNDIAAANAVFSSPLQLWQVPKNVYEMMPVSFAELQRKVMSAGKTGKYLFDRLMASADDPVSRKSPFRTGESWVLGDSPAVGLLIYEHRFCCSWRKAPLVGSSMEYLESSFTKPVKVYESIDPRLILEDFYAKLELFNPSGWSG